MLIIRLLLLLLDLEIGISSRPAVFEILAWFVQMPKKNIVVVELPAQCMGRKSKGVSHLKVQSREGVCDIMAMVAEK